MKLLRERRKLLLGDVLDTCEVETAVVLSPRPTASTGLPCYHETQGFASNRQQEPFAVKGIYVNFGHRPVNFP